jgi:predicted transcriptional regulator
MANNDSNRESAEWQFHYLKTLMDEEPTSVRSLAQEAAVSDSIIVKLRSGKNVKRSTIVKVQGAMEKLPKCGPVIKQHSKNLILKKGERTSVSRDDLMKFLDGKPAEQSA